MSADAGGRSVGWSTAKEVTMSLTESFDKLMETVEKADSTIKVAR